MQWFEALQVFVQVVENKSFVAAARKLHIPTSKVTKLVQWLEARLKTILLIRTTRQIHLTENGEYFFQRAKILVTEWQDLQATMLDKKQSPTGNLHLASPPGIFASEPFMQLINQFLKQHSGITITISTYAKPFYFLQTDADIFIGKESYLLDSSGVISKPCLTYQYGIYASPAYLKKHTKPKSPKDLSKHNCLGGNDAWGFRNGKQAVQGNFISDTSAAIQAAACENLGIARIPTFSTQNLVREGKLISLLEDYYADPEVLQVFYKQLNYQPLKLKLFLQALGHMHTIGL